MKHPLNTLGTTKVAYNKCVGKTSVTRKQTEKARVEQGQDKMCK